MRLPQDRILHIDIEYIENQAYVTSEWQGELVRCKDCKNADTVGVFVDGVVYCNEYQTARIEEGYCEKGERREDGE